MMQQVAHVLAQVTSGLASAPDVKHLEFYARVIEAAELLNEAHGIEGDPDLGAHIAAACRQREALFGTSIPGPGQGATPAPERQAP